MKFHFHNHNGKSDRLIVALLAHGWQQVQTPRQADVVFTDVDISQHSQNMEALHKHGKKIIMVPHAAQPNLFGDFEGYEPFPHTTVQFVPAQGHIDVMRAWGYNLPLEVIGWYLCDLQPFQARESIRNVLFAPIHPQADGSLSDVERGINQDAFVKLIDLCEKKLISLTVRYLGTPMQNGLYEFPFVKFVQGKPDQSTAEIDSADVVVAKQTMQYLAVARGVSCVGMGEDIAPVIGSPMRHDFKQVKSWKKYQDIMAYPLDILKHEDTMELLEYAAQNNIFTDGWRESMIGEQFSPNEFVTKLMKYI